MTQVIDRNYIEGGMRGSGYSKTVDNGKRDQSTEPAKVLIPNLSVNCTLGFENLLLVLQFTGLKIQPVGDRVFECVRKALEAQDGEALHWIAKSLAFIPFQDSKKRCLLKGNESTETIDWLVQRGLRISQVDQSFGLTPFHVCCASGCTKAAWSYLEQGQDISVIESRGWTPLHYAASYGCVEIVYMLCEHNANVNAVDTRGYNALQMATHKGHMDIVQQLLKFGARVVTTKRASLVEIENSENINPVAPALLSGPNKSSAFPSLSKSRRRSTPRCAIEIACRKNLPHILRIFLEAKLVLRDHLVKFPSFSPRTRTPLMTSVYYNSMECVQLLLSFQADVSEVMYKQTAISIACSKNHLEILALLLEHGEGPSHHGLKFAIRHGSLDSIKMIIQHPEFRLRQSSLVQCACKDKRFDIAWLLINSDTKRDIEDECKRLGHTGRESYFIHLVYTQFPSKVKQFIAGCCKDIPASKFWFGAAEHGPLEFIEHVFDNLSVDVNLQNRIGNTALHTACLANHPDIVFFLLKNGADPHLENKQMRIAEELCAGTPEMTQAFAGLADVMATFRRQSIWTNSLLVDPNQLFDPDLSHFGEFAKVERTYTSLTSPRVWNVCRESTSSDENCSNVSESIRVLAKDDDLRMEMFAMKMRQFLNQVIADVDYGNIPVEMVTYDIIPHGRRGLIEFVDNCVPLSKVKDGAIARGEPAADSLIDYFAKITNHDKLKHEQMLQEFEMTVCVEMAFVYLMGMGDNHGGNWLLREDGRHFRIDYSYFFGNKPKGSACPIPTTFNHVLQLCRPNWDAFILPTAVTIMKVWLDAKDDILYYAQGLLIGLEMDSSVWERMKKWTERLSVEEFAVRMKKDDICKGRWLKSVQHARHTSLRHVFTRLFWD